MPSCAAGTLRRRAVHSTWPPARSLRAKFGGQYSDDHTLSTLRAHLRFRMVKPEAHLHLAVHRRRRRQMLSGLLVPAGRSKELAQVEMDVGDEGAHLELGSQGQGLPVVAFRRLDVRWVSAEGDFAEQVEGPSLVAALPMAPGQGHALLCTVQRFVETSFEQVRLAEPGELHRPSDAHRAHHLRAASHLFEKVPALLHAPRDRPRVSKAGENCPRLEVPLTDDPA